MIFFLFYYIKKYIYFTKCLNIAVAQSKNVSEPWKLKILRTNLDVSRTSSCLTLYAAMRIIWWSYLTHCLFVILLFLWRMNPSFISSATENAFLMEGCQPRLSLILKFSQFLSFAPPSNFPLHLSKVTSAFQPRLMSIKLMFKTVDYCDKLLKEEIL